MDVSNRMFGINHSASEVYQLKSSTSKQQVFNSGYISNSVRASHNGNRSSGDETYQTSIAQPKETLTDVDAQVLLGFNLKSHSTQAVAERLEEKKDQIKILKNQSDMYQEIIQDQM